MIYRARPAIRKSRRGASDLSRSGTTTPVQADRRLSVQEEMRLVMQAQRGDSMARQRIIDAHYGLVLHLAASYHCPGLERDDVIQEGILGLMRALEGFDTGRGCRFATYATYWIRQGIQRAIDRTGRLIGLPVDLQHALQKVEAARAAFLRQNGYPPGLPELAAESGVSPRRLAGLLACLEAPLSLDLPREAEGEVPRELADPTAPDPEGVVLRRAEGEEVRRWLRALPEADRLVLERRYGLSGCELTEQEFLARHGLDRDAVRRIERRAIRRLRAEVNRRGSLSPAFT